jgi:hypothetical protein
LRYQRNNMNLTLRAFATAIICLSIIQSTYALPTSGPLKTNFDSINTITTGVPFLRINNDTRGGGMGDVGIAMSPDANGARINGAKMGFLDKDFGVGINFTPWLRGLASDIYLADLSGYVRIKNVQAIHASIRFFSLGEIQLTDDQGVNGPKINPQELAFDLGYSRRLSKVFSMGATIRAIYSNLSTQAFSTSASSKPGVAASGDLSMMVDKVFETKKGLVKHELLWGMNISNIGSKISYRDQQVRDFIPTNLGMGFGYKLHADPKKIHTFGVYVDFNKLLVPTPIQASIYDSFDNKGKVIKDGAGRDVIKQQYDQNRNGIPDYKEQGVIGAMFTSFADAPGGAAEELREITTQIGLEYFYKNIFGIRTGYFYEDGTKGGRQFLTVGATVHYSVASLHVSYLVPTTNQRTPLDNTFRFSLSFDMAKGEFKKATNAEPTEAGAPAELEKTKPNRRLKGRADQNKQLDAPKSTPPIEGTPIEKRIDTKDN